MEAVMTYVYPREEWRQQHWFIVLLRKVCRIKETRLVYTSPNEQILIEEMVVSLLRNLCDSGGGPGILNPEIACSGKQIIIRFFRELGNKSDVFGFIFDERDVKGCMKDDNETRKHAPKETFIAYAGYYLDGGGARCPKLKYRIPRGFSWRKLLSIVFLRLVCHLTMASREFTVSSSYYSSDSSYWDIIITPK